MYRCTDVQMYRCTDDVGAFGNIPSHHVHLREKHQQLTPFEDIHAEHNGC